MNMLNGNKYFWDITGADFNYALHAAENTEDSPILPTQNHDNL
jgi:hypothetical protein